MLDLKTGDLIYLETPEINFVGFFDFIRIPHPKFDPKLNLTQMLLLDKEEESGWVTFQILHPRKDYQEITLPICVVTRLRQVQKEDLVDLEFLHKNITIKWLNGGNLIKSLTCKVRPFREYARRELKEEELYG